MKIVLNQLQKGEILIANNISTKIEGDIIVIKTKAENTKKAKQVQKC